MMESAEPKRLIDLIDIDDPRCKKSTTDIAEP